MATEIIDLDAALPEDKQVRISGKVYRLPGDLPVELYLRIQRASKNLGTDGTDASIEDIRDSVLALFQSRDKTIKALPPEVGLAQMVTLITRVYAGEEEPNPRRTRGGATSSKPASRSRSSR